MGDLISRLAAIDALGEEPEVWCGDIGEYAVREQWRADVSAIKAVPSAEPHWIPVSERLPEDYQDVLVWFEYFRYGDYNCMYSTYGIGNYSSRYDSWLINHETGWKDLHVFAWMPLPEPPKMKGEQE